jgi:serine/threonine protein kinase
VIYKWTKQIADALAYLHDKVHILHRDIKPENILVTLPEENIKIIDGSMEWFLKSNYMDMEFLGKMINGLMGIMNIIYVKRFS